MVAVDSGMNRIGVQAEEVPEFLEGIKKYANITVHGFLRIMPVLTARAMST